MATAAKNETKAIEGAEVETERAILGSILVNQEHVYETMTELEVEDFVLASHRHIFRAMLELSRRSEAIDYHTLGAELGKHGVFESCGGTSYLADLGTLAIRRRSLASHLRLVKDASLRRQAVAQGERFLSALSDASEDTRRCLDMMHDWLLDLESGDREQQAVPIASFEAEVYNQLVEQSKSERMVLGVPTGLPTLDGQTTGVRKSEYWIVAGWPGHGKSALMMQMARAAVENDDCRVGIFSLEMRRDQLLLRLWAAMAGISAWKLRNPKNFLEEDWRLLNQVRSSEKAQKLSRQIFIDDKTGLSPENLAARAHLMIRQHGCNIVFLDYIQKVRGSGRDRREKVTGISEALFHLAKSTGTPVVALSQLSRPKDAELGNEPTMFMLKESGDLEADADTILLIHRRFKGEKEPDQIIIGKQRSGATDKKIDVHFNGSTLCFEEPQHSQPLFSNQQHSDEEEK